MEQIFLIFVPLFVAIDPIGAIPLFLSLTENLFPSEKRRLALEATLTALIIGMLFALAGKFIFRALGISPADFRVAGGILLVVLSIKEISGTTAKRSEGTALESLLGVVPLGIPFIAGPALLTTLIILMDVYPFLLVLLCFILNLFLTLGLLLYADKIVKKCGEAPARAAGKIIAIFLAAIGVMMIRKGLEELLKKTPIF